MVDAPNLSFMASEESGEVEFNDREIEALDQQMDDPKQDAAWLKVLSALGKVSKEKRPLEHKAAELMDVEQLYRTTHPIGKTEPTTTKASLAMKSRRMEETMKNAVDHGQPMYP